MAFYIPLRPHLSSISWWASSTRNNFPRRGEQCPVEEFSYKGYSPPKCTCIDMIQSLQHIEKQHMHFYMNAHMLCQCLEPSLTPPYMHTSCMKILNFQNKRFLFYTSTPWTVSKKLLYSKAMCLLWVTNFQGFTVGVVHPPTLSRTFTVGCICLTKNTFLSHEGVSIPSCYYPTHNFKPRNSRTSSIFQSPPFKHQT